MPALMEPPPYSEVEAVTEVLHGVPVTDPYRWLEDQESPRTREWISAQTRYARSYLDSIPGRERIRERIRELLDVETYDSMHKVGSRYFFRKRAVGQEQFCICMREGFDGADEVLVDPALRGTGSHTAVRPIRISRDGRLMLYEVKQGGERTGTFELLDIQKREVLPDVLPRGYLHGCAFSPDSRAFYYVHESFGAKEPVRRVACEHMLGTSFAEDREIFVAGQGSNLHLHIVPGTGRLGFLVTRFENETIADFFLWPFGSNEIEPVIRSASYKFGPALLESGRIFAITDRDAPNFKVVEVLRREGATPEFLDIIPAREARIQNWNVGMSHIVVAYLRDLQTQIEIFDLSGRPLGHVPAEKWDTTRLVGGSDGGEEVFLERESFARPLEICSYTPSKGTSRLWARKKLPVDSQRFSHTQVRFPAKDGTQIPMFLVGLSEVLEAGQSPAIMTSYGGFGLPMTPQFSVFAAYLMERGCLFALPNIRGGSEFGTEWHEAARRRNRQVAIDDFLAAADWLIRTGRAQTRKLASFGGSNSGLLACAAMTQRPDLFRAVVCMVPLLDMVRYHLFDDARAWKDEFGTAEDPKDLAALLGYSPYHNVRTETEYPAVLFVSGDTDQKCNPLHARKMTARLQAASISNHPVVLDYNHHRGHSPVLPLTDRIEALTDRMAFLCDQLQLSE